MGCRTVTEGGGGGYAPNILGDLTEHFARACSCLHIPRLAAGAASSCPMAGDGLLAPVCMAPHRIRLDRFLFARREAAACHPPPPIACHCRLAAPLGRGRLRASAIEPGFPARRPRTVERHSAPHGTPIGEGRRRGVDRRRPIDSRGGENADASMPGRQRGRGMCAGARRDVAPSCAGPPTRSPQGPRCVQSPTAWRCGPRARWAL